MTPAEKFLIALQSLPLIAILRGLTPSEAPAMGQALATSGFAMLEVPLNSPQPFDSIALLAQQQPMALVGAGTVLSASQVRDVLAAGGQWVVSPNFDATVVREALQLGLVCLPGIATPTEAFAALAAGAHGLKLFPAEQSSPAGLKAMRAVLPPATLIFPVGGIRVDNMGPWRSAGAAGFGLGSSLYQPGLGAEALQHRASEFVAAYRGWALA